MAGNDTKTGPKADTKGKTDTKAKGADVRIEDAPTGNAVAVADKSKPLATMLPTRIPYYPAIQEEFGISPVAWKALVEAIFPLAQNINSIAMALSYCKARNLDPFKRVVHIVPIWDKTKGANIDTIWPGIAELRTTAFRTNMFAGRDRTEFGPMIEHTFTSDKGNKVTLSFPEWAAVTVYRLTSKGEKVAYEGPQVYWLETYAQSGKSEVPNSMWQKRPRGQLDKCAEAAALRAAFPEEIGGDMTNDEAPAVVQRSTDVNAEAGVINQPRASTASEQLDRFTATPSAKPKLYPFANSAGEVVDQLAAAAWFDRLREALVHDETTLEDVADLWAANRENAPKDHPDRLEEIEELVGRAHELAERAQGENAREEGVETGQGGDAGDAGEGDQGDGDNEDAAADGPAERDKFWTGDLAVAIEKNDFDGWIAKMIERAGEVISTDEGVRLDEVNKRIWIRLRAQSPEKHTAARGKFADALTAALAGS